jgi:Uri superfamily endonuclease
MPIYRHTIKIEQNSWSIAYVKCYAKTIGQYLFTKYQLNDYLFPP